jgi:hypothetical protein
MERLPDKPKGEGYGRFLRWPSGIRQPRRISLGVRVSADTVKLVMRLWKWLRGGCAS